MSFTKQQYEAYIASPAWEAKRQRALRKQGRKCRACGSAEPGLHVHHHTYERFTCEHDSDLVVLCPACHKVVHRLHDRQRRRKGPNLTLTEVTFAFLARTAGTVYSPAVMADHTPLVAPKGPRSDGKRTVSMDRAARGPRTDPKGMTKKAVAARTARTRALRKRLGH